MLVGDIGGTGTHLAVFTNAALQWWACQDDRAGRTSEASAGLN